MHQVLTPAGGGGIALTSALSDFPGVGTARSDTPSIRVRQFVSASEAEGLLTSHLADIERAVAFACRRNRLEWDDAEEFAAIVKLKLVENDYAILRAWETRSSFSTYISIVVQRMALDYRIHEWGKWHSSAEAKRLGPLAVELEQLLHRDSRTLEQVLPILAAKHDGVTLHSLRVLLDRLPARSPKRHSVQLDEASPVAITRAAEVEEPLLAKERRRSSDELSSLMSEVIERLPEEDRLILQLRFEGAMPVAQVARVLGLDAKVTYRRIERRMRDIRDELVRAGIEWRDVLDLIGRDEELLHFELGIANRRPSKGADERANAHPEDSP
jgi:RNA polymerase sigma factor (sigma-70 family)